MARPAVKVGIAAWSRAVVVMVGGEEVRFGWTDEGGGGRGVEGVELMGSWGVVYRIGVCWFVCVCVGEEVVHMLD